LDLNIYLFISQKAGFFSPDDVNLNLLQDLQKGELIVPIKPIFPGIDIVGLGHLFCLY